MPQLIILRHGQSEWNLADRFTGWTDVDLSEQGRAEARDAGAAIRRAGLEPRYYFTSYLRRAIDTLHIAAAAMNRLWIPEYKDWHLNERHYGALQGLVKHETAARYGAGQVHIWRRSYDIQPPALTPDDTRAPARDPMYAAIPTDELPLTESLRDTIERVRPCWEERIIPALRLYDTVLVAAHGNSLRALEMMIRHIAPDDIVSLEIPTGTPILLTLDHALHCTTRTVLPISSPPGQ